MSAAAELERLADGRFAPGCSGNPRGRPPTPLEIRRVLAAKQWSALARLLRNIESGNDGVALALSLVLLLVSLIVLGTLRDRWLGAS